MKDSPCGECTQAWIDGRGAVDGVKPIDLLKRKEQAALGAKDPDGAAARAVGHRFSLSAKAGFSGFWRTVFTLEKKDCMA